MYIFNFAKVISYRHDKHPVRRCNSSIILNLCSNYTQYSFCDRIKKTLRIIDELISKKIVSNLSILSFLSFFLQNKYFQSAPTCRARLYIRSSRERLDRKFCDLLLIYLRPKFLLWLLKILRWKSFKEERNFRVNV